MNESNAKYSDLEELIEVAIKEIEIAPSLRDHAKQNLRRLVRSGDVTPIIQKIKEARARKLRAKAWLTKTPVITQLNDCKLEATQYIDPLQVQKKSWTILSQFAQKRQNKAWAKLVLQATMTLSTLDEYTIQKDTKNAEKACIDLLEAAETSDFQDESGEVKGIIFAETANIYTIFAKIKREKHYIERGLFLYNEAVEAILTTETPHILAVVQLNRGAALSCYAHLIQQSYLDSYKKDIEETIKFLNNDQKSHLYCNNQHYELSKQIKNDLMQIVEFNNKLSIWSRWSELASCSLDMAMEN